MTTQFRAALAVATRFGILAPRVVRAQESGIAVGAEAPAAMVQHMDGTPVDIATFYGDMPVVMEFWATWCPLCRTLEPQLQAAMVKYAGKVRFVGVGVASNQSAERQSAYLRKRELAGDYVFDASDAARKAFAAPHTSYVVVIDRNRKVVYTGGGSDQDIDAAVRLGLLSSASFQDSHARAAPDITRHDDPRRRGGGADTDHAAARDTRARGHSDAGISAR